MSSPSSSSSSSTAPRTLEGMEVPIIGSDRVRWAEVTVPSIRTPPPAAAPAAPAAAASLADVSNDTRDVAGCNIITGDSTSYLIWRIHKEKPNIIELVELYPCNEFPETGLHILFQHPLHPFAFICKNEDASRTETRYILYALTTSGVAYVFYLRSLSTYTSGSVFLHNELVQFDAQTTAHTGEITAVAASPGCLAVGMQDGSISYYQIGIFERNLPGFTIELRDDAGIARLWNFMSRGKIPGSVQDIIISEVCGRKLLFVLHVDGLLRIWDTSSRSKILNYSVSAPGSSPFKFWVGDADYDTNLIYFAFLHGQSADAEMEMVSVCAFSFDIGDRMLFSPGPSIHIPLEEGKLVDLKLSFNKLWILKEVGSMLYDLFEIDCEVEQKKFYGLQEDFIADELFQTSEHALDDLIWANESLFLSMKDQVTNFISSIFLRRLLQPGIHQNSVLRSTLLDHRKYFADNEFLSLTASGLRKEISTVVGGEGFSSGSSSTTYYWKNFCAHFLRHWCQNNVPYSLIVDSASGVVGLIRRSSISLFRSLEGVEHLIYGSDGAHDMERSGLMVNKLEKEVLFKVLRCISNINRQLGRAASAIFYESFINSPFIASEDVIFHFLKILETGYSPSVLTYLVPQLGFDAALEKKEAAHKIHRKFSVDMLLSFRSLLKKSNWTSILDVIEKYLNYLKPDKDIERFDVEVCYNTKSLMLIQATSQVAKVVFDSAFDTLLFLSYMVNVSGLVQLAQRDLARIQLKLIPTVQKILVEMLLVHFVSTTPSESLSMDDFSSRLSSLHIDNKDEKISLDGKLGYPNFTLACLCGFPNCADSQEFVNSRTLPTPSMFVLPLKKFSSVICGRTSEHQFSCRPEIVLVSLLIHHGQYEAAENILLMIGGYISKDKGFTQAQKIGDEWGAFFHLLGLCLLHQARNGIHGDAKEQKSHEAVRCFFRAASGQYASRSLQILPFQTGFHCNGEIESLSLWKLHYYQWAMQIFEQYGMQEAACQFAIASIQQLDEALDPINGSISYNLPDPVSTVRGRLWANVFKFKLDLKYYRDAYSAIISNPDEESKHICLRRFVNFLCEHNAAKILCDGQIPFVGLTENVERELVLKAERSDISSRPNIYKLLYAFASHRNNWRRAASYMLQYSMRLKNETAFNENHHISSALKERLDGLSAAINALHLVDPAYAWIDSHEGDADAHDQGAPNKKARFLLTETYVSQPQKLQNFVDCDILEKEYILTYAEYLLSLANVRLKCLGSQTPITNLVDALLQQNLYDMAFTLILKFQKGSAMKRELEQSFVFISEKCCLSSAEPSFTVHNFKAHDFLLPSTMDETDDIGLPSASILSQKVEKSNSHWEALELYLEKYRSLHARLPVVVAETLLCTNPEIELPLWLVQMFKRDQKMMSWGMTGQESDPATLFRLYVEHGRHVEATNLLLEYLDSFATSRPVDIINRKKMSAVWFPYVAIERLWCQLEVLEKGGHMASRCDKLKGLIRGVLTNHLEQVKVDSDDTASAGLLTGSMTPWQQPT